MTNVGQAATAELAAAATAAPGRVARVLGVIAVALALLSALATFLVLANLTPIPPTHDVVVSVLLCNAATVLLLLGVIALGGLAGRPGAPARPRRLAAACADRRAVFDHRRGAGDPGRRRRQRHARSRPRPAVLANRPSAMIQNSLIVAEAYLREQAEIVRADTIAVAIEFTRAKPMFDREPRASSTSSSTSRPASAGFPRSSCSTATPT